MEESLKELDFLKLIKTYTVSSILILPIYNDLYKLKKASVKAPPLLFNQLLFSKELKNCFLCFKDNKYHLIVEIPINKFQEPIECLSGHLKDVNSLLLTNEYLLGVKRDEEEKLIRYLLKIPEEFQQDIKILMSSSYSKLSDEYKNRIKVKYTSVGLTDHPVADSLVTLQIPYFITKKARDLVVALEHELGMSLEEDLEIYEYFDLNKELKC